MTDAPVAVTPTLKDDPFEVLGVEKTATDDEIKAAYRKLALKYHPDKNPDNEEAQANFQKVQTAWGILSSPELRKKYETGGLEALDEAVLTAHGIQVDVSQMGLMGSTLFAMFRKLGHPVKTVISQAVLDAVKAKSFDATPLQWGTPAKGRVSNGQAVFYTLDVSTEHISKGFVIHADCMHVRVKLLLWDLDEAGEWAMAASEDAVKIGDMNVAALFHTNGETFEGVPKSVQAFVQTVTVTEKGSDPMDSVFRVLDGVKPRDRLSLRSGTHLLAVYGDNFFKKSTYTVQADMLASDEQRSGLEAADRALIDKRGELAAMEKDFKKARKEYEAAVARLESQIKEVDECIREREAQYAAVLGVPLPSQAGTISGSASPDKEDSEATIKKHPLHASESPAAVVAEDNVAGAGSVFKKAGTALNATVMGLFGKRDRPPPAS